MSQWIIQTLHLHLLINHINAISVLTLIGSQTLRCCSLIGQVLWISEWERNQIIFLLENPVGGEEESAGPLWEDHHPQLLHVQLPLDNQQGVVVTALWRVLLGWYPSTTLTIRSRMYSDYKEKEGMVQHDVDIKDKVANHLFNCKGIMFQWCKQRIIDIS